MPATATFRLLIDTATGEIFNFNSSGEAWGVGGGSQNSFIPSSFEVTRNISSKTVRFTIPRLEDANSSLSLLMLSDTLQADAKVRYSIFINGQERILLYGRVADTLITDSEISITVSSFLENLKYSKVQKLSANCSNQFGDSLCQFDRSTITDNVTIASISDDRLSFTVNETMSLNQYQDGTITLVFPAGRDVEMDVAVNDETTVFLWERLPEFFNIGDNMPITPGCLKTESACQAYSNFINFRGLPSTQNFSPTTLQSIAGASS